MIHLSSTNVFKGELSAVLYGKGPSYDPSWFHPGAVRIGINDAATEAMDWVALRDWTTSDRLLGVLDVRHVPHIVAQRVWFRFPGRYGTRDWYFDESRVFGTTTDSKSVPGRKLGVGTATAVLQMLGQAGVERVYLNGFDSFWGGTIEYADYFKARGLSHGDYAEAFPASGTPEEQAALVRESMQLVIDRYGLDVKEGR